MKVNRYADAVDYRSGTLSTPRFAAQELQARAVPGGDRPVAAPNGDPDRSAYELVASVVRYIDSWPFKILVAFALWLIAAAVGKGRLKALYQQHLRQTRRERLFLASFSFLITFVIIRIITHAIRAGVGPFHNVSRGDLHIHHMVWGILLLLGVGYGWLLQIGTGIQGTSRITGIALSILYGMAAALTLDEFALWLNLRDVYWEREGRESIHAVMLFGGILSVGIYGRPFVHALVKNAFGLLKPHEVQPQQRREADQAASDAKRTG